MTGAIFGLLGVIVGGVLTGAVEALRESRAQRASSRAAARLLSAELSVQEAILQRRAGEASARPEVDRLPAVIDWPEQRVVMAKTLDDPTWIAVAGAYANLVVWHATRGGTSGEPGGDRQEMTGLAAQLHEARESLRDFRFHGDAGLSSR